MRATVPKKSRIFAVVAVLATLACRGSGAQNGAPTAAVTGQAASTSEDGSEQLQEVTVTARHAELARRVSDFVANIATRSNEDGLPRWQYPICPLVSGLPREDGEFILGRLSQIAGQAGAPLAAQNCRPNLYILVHPKPKELLQAMAKRNRVFTVGNDDTPPNAFDEVISTPRAVRVWYTTEERNFNGVVFARRNGDPPPGVLSTGSRLDVGVVWQLAHVFVVVDRTRMQGVTRGQLADYVAMVALADLKPGAPLGDAPTILRLFEGTPQAAPAGMSDWDQAFLKALYLTDQKSTLQRSQIAHQMVEKVAP